MLAIVAAYQDQAVARIEGKALDHREPSSGGGPHHAADPETPERPSTQCDQAEDQQERESEFEEGCGIHGMC